MKYRGSQSKINLSSAGLGDRRFGDMGFRDSGEYFVLRLFPLTFKT